jgi:hypothetical protein
VTLFGISDLKVEVSCRGGGQGRVYHVGGWLEGKSCLFVVMNALDLPEGYSLFIYHCMWRKKSKHGFKLKLAYGNLAAPSQQAAEQSARLVVAEQKGAKHKLISLDVRLVELLAPTLVSLPSVHQP